MNTDWQTTRVYHQTSLHRCKRDRGYSRCSDRHLAGLKRQALPIQQRLSQPEGKRDWMPWRKLHGWAHLYRAVLGSCHRTKALTS